MTDQRQVGRPSGMRTRIIILTGPTPSSTLCIPEEYGRFDLLIHCGNLTQHSTGSEFGQVMRYIRRFNVGPKILIAGDKDVSLDPQAYRFHSRRQVHVAEESTAVYEDPKADEVDAGAPAPSADAAPIESRTQALGKERRLQTRKYERPEATRTRMQKMWRWNVRFLNEGTQEILLPNRAPLRLYVSSYTPDAGKSLAFQYQTHHHDFSIEPDTDIVVTHGPPWAVLDRSPPESSALYCKGSTSLWHAIKRAPPRLHCFGPERTWRGAAVATWQGSDSPLWAEVDATQEPDSQELSGVRSRLPMESGLPTETSHCTADRHPVGSGQTLFLNACSAAPNGVAQPWIMNIELPARIDDAAHSESRAWGEGGGGAGIWEEQGQNRSPEVKGDVS